MRVIVDQMKGYRNHCWVTFLYEQSISSNYFDIIYTRKFRPFYGKICYIGVGHIRANELF